MSLIILWRCAVSLRRCAISLITVLRFAMSLIIVLRFAMSLAVLLRCAVSLTVLWRYAVSLLRCAVSLTILLRYAVSLTILWRCAVSLLRCAVLLTIVWRCAVSLTILWSCAVSLLRCAMSLNISLTSLLMWVHPVYVPSVLCPCIPSSCFLSHANWNRRSHVIKSSRMDPFKQLACRAVQQQHQMEECKLERMGESQNAKSTRNSRGEPIPLSRHSLPCFPLGLAASVL